MRVGTLILPAVANEVSGDNIIFSVTQDALKLALRLLPDHHRIKDKIRTKTHGYIEEYSQ